MGLKFSHLPREITQWEKHMLECDDKVRKTSLSILETIPVGVDIFLGAVDKEFGGLKFKHWFVTDLNNIIEFGSALDGIDLYSETVAISNHSLRKYWVDRTTLIPAGEFDTTKRSRAFYLLGMKHYSICLRNSEHVANYIVYGHWSSSQMGRNEPLGKFFNKQLGDFRNKLNCFPTTELPCNVSTIKPVYTFTDNIYKAREYSYYLDNNTDCTKNIFLFGTTGSGKSHLVNIMFNNQICESNQGHTSVTTEICFITGDQIRPTEDEPKKVVVADTIGLCDTDWDEQKILEFIKGRTCYNVSHIDVVIIVFKADRLIPTYVNNIKEILKWLNFKNHHRRFIFVATNADAMTPEDVESQAKVAAEKFDIKEALRTNASRLIYVSFPREKSLNALTKAKCQKSWEDLKKAIQDADNGNRIPVPSMKKSCAIL